ncbi:unnamed protein product [Alternaria alternata]
MLTFFIRQIGRIGGSASQGINLEEAFNWLTFDIIGDLAFGESFDAVAKGQTNFWVSLIIDATWFMMLGNLRYRLPIITVFLPFVAPKGAAKNFHQHMLLTQEKLSRRLKMESSQSRADFFSHLLRKDGSDVPEPELRQQAMTLIVAGSETTATCLTGLAYFLLKNNESLARLTQEIRSQFQSCDQITGDSTANLTYLQAIIEEGLRIFPPAPFGLPRTCPGAVIDGHHVPSGTTVSVDHWTTKHDSRYWNEPMEFKPERWIDSTSQDVREAESTILSGTSKLSGPSISPYLEMRIILAKMVFELDWELVNKDLDFLKETRLYLLWKKPAVVVRFHERKC